MSDEMRGLRLRRLGLPPNPITDPHEWIDYWRTWSMMSSYENFPTTRGEDLRQAVAARVEWYRERALAARAALSMNDYVGPEGRLERAGYLLKTLACLALGRTRVPEDRWHHSIRIAYWNYYHGDYGWDCDTVEVGPGWRDWWADIGHDGDSFL